MNDELRTLLAIRDLLDQAAPLLDTARGIDALGTPGSYRMTAELLETLRDDLDGMIDTREWADLDGWPIRAA